MASRWKIFAVALTVAALAGVSVPLPAYAGGGMFNGSGTNGGVCKSGKHVRNMKACKENGGKY